MKKLLCLALAAMLCLALAACAVAEGTWKIAILTGTTSQGEEEFRAAERAQKADPEHIITDTYPDNFMAETETTISKLVAFASDPDVKAIVMCQAVPGAKAAFDKIRAMGRDDMLLIAGVPQEDPAVITAAADFVLYTDEPRQGDTIMETCAKWGVDVFVHYSFPRHLAMETIAARKALLEENAAALGIEYVEATAPDPTGDAGVAGAQKEKQAALARCAALEAQRDELLRAAGLCAKPKFTCPLCSDTGRRGDALCTCVQQLVREMRAAELNAAFPLELSNGFLEHELRGLPA